MPDVKRIWLDAKAEIVEVLDGLNEKNVKDCCWDLFQVNLFVGKVAFVRQILERARQQPSRELAAVLAVVNSEVPSIGALSVQHLIRQFKSSVRKDSSTALNTAIFVADLYNHGLVRVELVAQMILILRHFEIENCVAVLERVVVKSDVREYLAKKFMAVKYEPFKLDIVMDKYKTRHDFDIYVEVEALPEHEHEWPDSDQWPDVQKIILGTEEPSAPEQAAQPIVQTIAEPPVAQGILDMTRTEDTNFKKHVYLVVMSALSAEEATHKVLRIQGDPRAIVKTIVEIASQEKTPNSIYANIGYRLSRMVDDRWRLSFESEFADQWDRAQEYETNQIRNLGRLFGYLLASDSLDWQCLTHVDLTIEGSTPSTRIFLQSVFEEMRSEMGVSKLVSRLKDPELAGIGIFPVDTDDKKFARDFFRAIKIGPVADLLRSRINAD